MIKIYSDEIVLIVRGLRQIRCIRVKYVDIDVDNGDNAEDVNTSSVCRRACNTNYNNTIKCFNTR
jgi:hypothetical protein